MLTQWNLTRMALSVGLSLGALMSILCSTVVCLPSGEIPANINTTDNPKLPSDITSTSNSITTSLTPSTSNGSSVSENNSTSIRSSNSTTSGLRPSTSINSSAENNTDNNPSPSASTNTSLAHNTVTSTSTSTNTSIAHNTVTSTSTSTSIAHSTVTSTNTSIAHNTVTSTNTSTSIAHSTVTSTSTRERSFNDINLCKRVYGASADTKRLVRLLGKIFIGIVQRTSEEFTKRQEQVALDDIDRDQHELSEIFDQLQYMRTESTYHAGDQDNENSDSIELEAGLLSLILEVGDVLNATETEFRERTISQTTTDDTRYDLAEIMQGILSVSWRIGQYLALLEDLCDELHSSR